MALPDANDAQSTDILNFVNQETAPRTGRFFAGAVIGAVVGGLVAGLIVVSLGDPQRIYVTEKIDADQEIGQTGTEGNDNQSPVTPIALDAETVSDED